MLSLKLSLLRLFPCRYELVHACSHVLVLPRSKYLVRAILFPHLLEAIGKHLGLSTPGIVQLSLVKDSFVSRVIGGFSNLFRSKS